MNLVIYKSRKKDSFLFFNYFRYAYVQNDPVNCVDLWGLEARDKFSSVWDALIDFAETYNDDSINNKIEYGTTLYMDKDGNCYYSTPNIGSTSNINMYTVPENITDTPIGLFHTHGNSDPDYDGENFSNTDKQTAKDYNIQVSVVTPGGSLGVYCPAIDEEIWSRKNPPIPSDPDSGNDRVTKVDPKSGNMDPYVELDKQVDPPISGGKECEKKNN